MSASWLSTPLPKAPQNKHLYIFEQGNSPVECQTNCWKKMFSSLHHLCLISPLSLSDIALATMVMAILKQHLSFCLLMLISLGSGNFMSTPYSSSQIWVILHLLPSVTVQLFKSKILKEGLKWSLLSPPSKILMQVFFKSSLSCLQFSNKYQSYIKSYNFLFCWL